MSLLSHLTLDDTHSGNVAVDQVFDRPGWTRITGSDRLSRSSISVDTDDHKVRVAFTANRGASNQVLQGQGFIAPYYIRLATNGALFLVADGPSSTVTTEIIPPIPDGEFVDVEINIRWTSDEVVVTGFGDSSQYDATVAMALIDSPSVSGFFTVAGYGNGGTFPCTDAVVHRVSVTHGSTAVLDYDFSLHATEDQVGSFNLGITGSPLFQGGRYTNITPSAATAVGLTSNSGTAIDFSGSGYINLGSRLDFTGDFSVDAVLDINPTETIGGIASRWHSSQGWLVLAINGKIRVYRDGSFIESTSDFPVGAFHLTVTAEGTTGKIYFDGVEDVSGTFSSATHTLASATDAQIASYTDSASAGVNLLGTADEVRVHDNVLTPTQVTDRYNELFQTAQPWLYAQPSRFELV